MDRESNILRITSTAQVQKMQEVLCYLLEEFHVHFLEETHVCISPNHQRDMEVILAGRHPSIKVIYIRKNILGALNAVHRAFTNGQQACTVCPICGQDTA